MLAIDRRLQSKMTVLMKQDAKQQCDNQWEASGGIGAANPGAGQASTVTDGAGRQIRHPGTLAGGRAEELKIRPT